MNLSLLSPRVWIEIAIAAFIAFACWYAYNWVYDRGADSVQVKWDKEKLAVAEQSAKIASAALETTKTLSLAMDQQRSETNAQITTLNATVANAITGLRNRPARDGNGSVSGNPSTGTTSQGCTGKELYRDDGEFLARFAGETERLRISLKACYARYEAAKTAVSK